MSNTNNDKEFLKSHSTGFGGSSARMFYRAGKNGIDALTAKDKRRIAIALGQIEREGSLTTEAMQAGNDFERHWAKKYTRFENNKRIENEEIKARNFEIFAHADFADFADEQTVIELKYSQKSTKEVMTQYKAQLQWYYMLGVEKVQLLHGWGDVPFNPNNYKSAIFNIARDEKYISILKKGIKLIDDYCDTFQYEHTEKELNTLAIWDRELIQAVANKVQEAKRLDDEIKELKAKLYELMSEKEIDKIVNDDFTATLVKSGVTNTINWKKAFNDLNINEVDYTESKPRKGYVIIK